MSNPQGLPGPKLSKLIPPSLVDQALAGNKFSILQLLFNAQARLMTVTSNRTLELRLDGQWEAFLILQTAIRDLFADTMKSEFKRGLQAVSS